MPTVTTEERKEIETARKRADYLRERIEQLEAEVIGLREGIEKRQDELLQTFIDGGDPKRLQDAQRADNERIQTLRAAIQQARLQHDEAEKIAGREVAVKWSAALREFDRSLLQFIDVDFAALLKKYEALEAQYWQVWNTCPERELRPYVQKELFETFYIPFNSNALPSDLNQLRKRAAAWFETTRGGK